MYTGLTKAGEIYLANRLANKLPVNFLKVKIGNGTVPHGADASETTELYSFKKEIQILDITQTDNVARIRVLIDNSDVEQGFFMKELGVYVDDDGKEKLYWYVYEDNGQYVHSKTERAIQFDLELVMEVTSSNSTILDWNKDKVWISKTYFDEKVRTYEIPTIADLQSRKNLKVGDIVEVLGYYSAGDGAGHKRIIANTAKGFNSITLNNSLYANLIKDSDIKNIVLKKDDKYNDIIGMLNSDFNVVKIKKINGKYEADIEKERFGTRFKTIYIDINSKETGLGEDYKGITLKQFKTNLDSGLYNNYDLKVYFKNKIIMNKDLCGVLNFNGKKIELKSLAKGGTWITTFENITPIREDGLKAVYSKPSFEIAHLVEFSYLDENGMPSVLKKVETESELVAGSYCVVGSEIISYPFLNGGNLKMYALAMDIGVYFKVNTYYNKFENINFAIHSSAKASCDIYGADKSIIYLKNCKFLCGEYDSLAIHGYYKALISNCIAAYGNKDCFNYHSNDKSSIAVEVNCIGYGAGMNKTATGNQTAHSNNATTTHDGMTVYRFGSIGYNCEGPVLADVNGCKSINFDCYMSGSTTSSGHNANYFYEPLAGNFNEFVLINCKNGKITQDGVKIKPDCKFICDYNENILENQNINITYDNLFKGGI